MGNQNKDSKIELEIEFNDEEAYRLAESLFHTTITYPSFTYLVGLKKFEESVPAIFKRLTILLIYPHSSSEAFELDNKIVPEILVKFSKTPLVLYRKIDIEDYLLPKEILKETTGQTDNEELASIIRTAISEKQGEFTIENLSDILFSRSKVSKLPIIYVQNEGIRKISPIATHIFYFYNEEAKNQNHVTTMFFLGLILQKTFAFVSDIRKIESSALDKSHTLNDDGSNLFSYLFGMHKDTDLNRSENFERLQVDFKEIFKNSQLSFDIQLKWMEKKSPNGIPQQDAKLIIYDEGQIQWKKKLDSSNVGAGVLEALFLLAKSMSTRFSVLLMDEPALHLHPTQIRAMYKKIKKIMDTTSSQLIVISHSPALIDPEILGNSGNLMYVRRDNGQTKIIQSSTKDKKRLHELLPRLRYDLNPEIFFSKCILLVEGDADKGFFRSIWTKFETHFKLENFDDNDILLLDAGGAPNIPFFVELFEIFRIQYVVISDKDALMRIGRGGKSELLKALEFTEIYESVKAELPALLKTTQITDSKNNTITEYLETNQIQLEKIFDKANMFIIGNGELEDLLSSINKTQFELLRKTHGSTRYMVYQFVDTLNPKDLQNLVWIKNIFDRSIHLSKTGYQITMQ